jgi:hypothetical protein
VVRAVSQIPDHLSDNHRAPPRRKRKKMKTASRIFVILGMVCAALSLLFAFAFFSVWGKATFDSAMSSAQSSAGTQVSQESIDQAYFLYERMVLIIFSICVAACEIVGGIALKRISNAVSKGQLIAIGIFTILFCSIPGGILMLCIPEDQLG